MNTIANILLIVKGVSVPVRHIASQSANDFWVPLLVFGMFIWFVYMVLSPGKRNKIKV